MWLVQLYKANENEDRIVELYSTNECNIDYIDSEVYEYELNLCANWEDSKKRLLILKKGRGAVLEIPRNERIIAYNHSYAYFPFIHNNSFIIFEYLTQSGFVMDFYFNTKIMCYFRLPADVSISGIGDLVRYIRDKTFNIRVINETTPKYSIRFDDYNCSYYAINNVGIIIIKKPFLFKVFYYLPFIYFYIYATPMLIDDINDFDSTTSNYNAATDQAMNIDNIVDQYFNVNNAMSGRQYGDVPIDHDDNNVLGYNLTMAFLGFTKYGVIDSYNFTIDNTEMYHYYNGNSLPDNFLSLAPLYTYFPLLRPKLDGQGLFSAYPQYHPLDEDSFISNLSIYIRLSNTNSVVYFYLSSSYFSFNSWNNCLIAGHGHLPSWDSDECDLTVPFRFVGASNCNNSETDLWASEQVKNNANYLFKIAKLPSSDTYSIKGVGCNEITQPLSFSTDSDLQLYLSASFLQSLHKVRFSGFGYAFDRISHTLSNEVTLENSETCFVLFSDNLIENEDDFSNIYTSVRDTLANAIVCYFGDDSKVPQDLKNKVLHSNAIVTDLETNEQMPIVIKYIRYAKRLHELFNG